MKKLAIFFSALMIASGCLCAPPTIMQRADSQEAERWADSVYNSLNDRERIAQLLCPKTIPKFGHGDEAIKKFIETNQVGALLLGEGSIDQYVELTNMARQMAKVPPLMTFDGEWGAAMRVNGTLRFPCNMALGAIQDPKLLRAYGREVGRQLRLLGHNVDFAPVVDVNSNPRNPVIGFRSFGEDPHRVALLGAAMSQGLEDAGVQAVAKHFPGHGDTSTDSHKERTTVYHSAQVIDDVDLVPFRAFVDSGCSGIMVGHIVVPSIDDSGMPASLSQHLTTGLLRQRLGFNGLIYTDALGMKGAHVPGVRPELAALKAGADVLLTYRDPAQDIDAILEEIAAGRITWSLVEDRCKRILRYKYALGLPDEGLIDSTRMASRLNSAESRRVSDMLSCAAITILRNNDDILPLKSHESQSIAVVNIGAGKDTDFVKVCKRSADKRRRDDFNVYTGQSLSASDLSEIRKHDVVIAAVYADSAYCRNIYSQLQNMPNLVGVFMVSPYKMNKFNLDHTKAIVLAYEDLPDMERAAAMAILGSIGVNGRLPVNLPGFPLGSGLELPYRPGAGGGCFLGR